MALKSTLEHRCEFETCSLPASACAALTDSEAIVIAHKFLCEEHARSIFAVNVDRQAKLEAAIRRVKAKSSANERVKDLDDFEGE